MKTIKLCDVNIREDFIKTKPKHQKILKVREYIEKHKTIDKPIVLLNGVLVDGYARYLASVEKELYEVPYVELCTMNYIVGKFEHCKKEYVWKNDKGIDIQIGDKVMVKTFNNNKDKLVCKYVTVVDIFWSDSLDLYKKHKRVIKKNK